jgi:hypothetical protein
VIGAFPAQVITRQPPQFLINQRHQCCERVTVSTTPSDKQLRNRTGRFLLQEASDLPKAPEEERRLARKLSLSAFPCQ